MAQKTRQEIDYPVIFLHNAFYEIEHRGHEAFRNYVKKVGMPVEDIERVLNKYNYWKDPEFRTKIDGIVQNIGRILNKSDIEMPF